MDPSIAFVLMLFPFAVLLAFGVWQLASVSRAKKRRLERERSARAIGLRADEGVPDRADLTGRVMGAAAFQPARTRRRQGVGSEMAKPIVFTVAASWDSETEVWSGSSADIPAAADDPTLDGLMRKISLMALDLAPDKRPGVDPDAIFIQINALRQAQAA
ncbi:uncharacterized protein DUF1902 [Roseiarcus fermentans]|uniref:Uncharacterized protein DUF1902 n=1 Tax=Roseiarcus fermentans TaxID=1473586 RepID=A0A366FBH5_9HYPH|nr:DUF1902 domain-containing protein [Roseiarcus fermentans]RBP11310.1 uncharacterized protein DUF1902 [Roseiarcus fermentans]